MQRNKYIAISGVFTALIVVMTAYMLHIPVGVNGGYIHLGDAFIYLAAALLPKSYALVVAALGGGLADLLTAPMWCVPTVLIKMSIASMFTSKEAKIINKRNLIACIPAFLITGIGYYIAEYLLFETKALFWISISQSGVQSVGSAVVFILLGIALDKNHVKAKYL